MIFVESHALLQDGSNILHSCVAGGWGFRVFVFREVCVMVSCFGVGWEGGGGGGLRGTDM